MWIQECWLHNFAICFSATEVTMLMDVSWFLCRENFKISVLFHFHTQQIFVFLLFSECIRMFSSFFQNFILHVGCKALWPHLSCTYQWKTLPFPPHVNNVATRWVHGYSMHRSFVKLGINGYISYHDLNRLFQKHALNWMFTYL